MTIYLLNSSPRPPNAKHKLTWLSTICRSHLKLASCIPGAEMAIHVPPWSSLPIHIITNDNLPPKQTTDPKVLRNITLPTMTDSTQPGDHIYFTDGSVSGCRVSAAFTYLGHPTFLRLSDNASIMKLSSLKSMPLYIMGCTPPPVVLFSVTLY